MCWPVRWRSLVPLALLGLWAAWSAGSDTYYFPPLTDILDDVRGHLAVRARRLATWCRAWSGSALGYGIACVAAVALGLALGMSRRLRRGLDPVVQFLRSIPPPALLPFGILVLGVGTSMKVFIIAFVCLWPVLLNTDRRRRGRRPDAARDRAIRTASRGATGCCG